MNKVKYFITIFPILLFSYILFCFSSCSMKAEQKSLTVQFEIIDSLIMQSQFSDAVKDLKKLEKHAFDPWICISIYKRYAQLGEVSAAEKVLKKSLKKNEHNLELNAILAKLLISQNRFDEALKVASFLKSTDYGSVYSECVLKHSLSNSEKKDDLYYKSQDLYQVYYDAYVGTKNPIWIRNCAIFNILNGLYENAFSLIPSSFLDFHDAYFWALVCYDSKHYYECADLLAFAQKNFDVDLVKTIALQSDSYVAISDMEAAENARQTLIKDINSIDVSSVEDEDLLPIIFVNSAIWAKNQQLESQCADILFYTVNKWPTFVPGLILYSDFAYESNKNRVEDDEMLNLRNAGIFSKEMELYDSRRKIPLSDALYRIEKALKESQNAYLSLAQLDLKYKMDRSVSQKDKLRDLWYMLEENNEISQEFKSLLVQYAVNFLLGINDFDNAWDVFITYINSTVKSSEKDSKKVILDKNLVWNYLIENIFEFELPIIEIASYFSASFGFRTETTRLLEFCVYESGGILDKNVISPYVSNSTAMNLANVYCSIGKTNMALDLYGKIAGRESKNSVRSEIFYKIACIYTEQGDKKNALRSVDYALSIFPENAKASLLKTKLQ